MSLALFISFWKVFDSSFFHSFPLLLFLLKAEFGPSKHHRLSGAHPDELVRRINLNDRFLLQNVKLLERHDCRHAYLLCGWRRLMLN